MKITVEKEITLASFRKRISSTRLGKLYARAEGKAKFAVETEDTEKDKVELKISKEAEVKVNDLFFGAHGAISVSKDKLEFKLGLEEFEVTFSPSIVNPVSFHISDIKLPVPGTEFRLERELPSLGLQGKAEIEVEFVIDFVPNYGQLAKALSPKNVRAAIQVAKNQLYTVARKGKTVGRVIVKAGRGALYAPLKWLGNGVGRKFAHLSVKLGSQTAALRRLIGRAGRLLGPAGIAVDAWFIVKDSIPGLLAGEHKKVIDFINPRFVEGYATLLTLYTDTAAPLNDRFFSWVTVIERVASEPPDMYGVIETLSKTGDVTPPKRHAGNWRDDQIAKGIKYRAELLPPSEVDWQALYREAYNITMLFLDMAQHASNQQRRRVATGAIAKAGKLVEVAGMVAAYQDILAFMLATSVYEDLQGSQPTDVWEDWKAVGEFHRAVFGADSNRRLAHYKSLIDAGSLTVTIPPFGDYADWAA